VAKGIFRVGLVGDVAVGWKKHFMA